MNILTQYTRRCLGKNRVRTLVTVIGIILSVALFTAVAEGAASGRQYLVDVATADVGAYHGMYDEISDEELSELRGQEGLAELATLDGVGWAMVSDSTQVYPYLRISAMSENFRDLVSVRILEGRLPENENEIIISDRASASTGAELRVGQRLSLDLGQRETLDGLPLGEHNPYLFEEERLVGTARRDYTIVGMYDRLSSDIEGYEMPGTLALTVGAAGAEHKAFFTLDRIGDTLGFLAEHPYGSVQSENRDLLLYSGVSENRLLVRVIYSLAAILFALIFLGSVALIYNSFSISVSERTKQFGLLKSVGATNKQIRRTVLTEALLLCVIGIPVGLLVGVGGIGLTLRFLRPAFDTMIRLEGAGDVSMRLSLSVPALLIAAGIGLFTALVSAWIPAKRATRLSPISAIRQSADVKVRAREVRSSRLTGKLFGFPGTLASKNFKRSRKQYRSTVISLFLSIVLFISAFSFADALRRDVGGSANEYASDLIVRFESSEEESLDLEKLLRELRMTEGITDGACAIRWSCGTAFPAAALSREAAALWQLPDEEASVYANVFFTDEASYRGLCAKTGLNPEDGLAVAFVKQHGFQNEGDGTRYVSYDVLRADALPLTLELLLEKEPEGYFRVDQETDPESGKNTAYLYYPENGEFDPEGHLKEELILRLPAEEVEERQPLRVGAITDALPLSSYREEFSLFLPLSAAKAVAGREAKGAPEFFFNAANHAAGQKALTEQLDALGLGDRTDVYDTRDGRESSQAFLLVLNVFTFGFIVLISLIAAANVFNTISTNVALRRREFATLKSVGMGDRAFGRMMRFECLLYGSKALLLGLPVSIGVSWLIWKAVNNAFEGAFRIPWTAMAIAAGSVFLVVFATMLYATGKIKKDNPIDALKQETL